jgi:hypothetical protein
MSNIFDRLELQNKEFDAVGKLSKAYKTCISVPVVDDDYPEVRYNYECALEDTIAAFRGNGRIPGGEDFPEVICLCGSTRFYEAFQKANYDLTCKGKIVLSVGFYVNNTGVHGENVGCNPKLKIALDELHKRKIDLAESIFVLNVGGYIGESTKSEIEYAKKTYKKIHYLEEPNL